MKTKQAIKYLEGMKCKEENMTSLEKIHNNALDIAIESLKNDDKTQYLVCNINIDLNKFRIDDTDPYIELSTSNKEKALDFLKNKQIELEKSVDKYDGYIDMNEDGTYLKAKLNHSSYEIYKIIEVKFNESMEV